MIGSTVSHYRISGRLPGEGIGVYRARDLDGGGQALLYLFAPENGAAEAVDRFRRAALDAANLGHPAIAPVLDLGETDDGRLFVALPSFEGETLESRLGRGPLLPVEAVRLAVQLASGLARAHEEGIVHGDLRPAWILVGGEDEARIFGFGLGELCAPGPPAEEEIAAYRAPERLRGEPPGPRSDVWSLGVVLYEMVAGRLPFAEDEAWERTVLHRSPGTIAESLPAGLDRIIARALARRPEGRYPNAAAMASDLLRCLESIAGLEDLAPPTRLEIPVAYAGGRRAARAAVQAASAAGELAGRDLPSYRVFERLGSGGMAVVYRAEDTRLGRPVALKFLAPELSRDPEAKARFLQEAKAASALDHPNLCTVHEVGETEDGQIFLSMPYYGGETLRERIDRGALPLEEALDVALQIALGLAKAHRHGIVHRDVKPANVMLTPDGVVKILDFGLAKLVGSSGPQAGGPAAGTLAYLSPEQARGEDVDLRTDLWSLGVVLYEMVTGRKPFAADREQAVLYGILQGHPDPVSRLLPGAPPELERILARLLAKDRDARYPDAESVIADLRALRGPESLTSWPASPRPLPRSRRRWWSWAAAGAAVAAAGLALLVATARKGDKDGPVRAGFAVLTDQTGKESFPSVSPDGDFFVYVRESGGDLDLFWQRVGGGNPRNLTADRPEDDSHPAVSPDGQRIAFRSERAGGGIYLMGSTGESVRRLTDFCHHPAWSPDGREIVCSTEGVSGAGRRGMDSQLWRIEVATGARRLVTHGDAVQPSWSPHGWRIAYWSIRPGSSERVIWTLPAGGGEPLPAVRGGSLSWNPVWSPDGKHLYFASNRGGSMNLWRVPIDERSGKLRGQPQPMSAPVDSGGLISLSRDGRRLVFASEDDRSNLVRAGLDPVRMEAGPVQAITEGSLAIRSGEISPDGEWIVYDVSEPQEDLFLIRPDGSGMRQLTNDPARDRVPRWSPDGRRILFYSDRDGGKYDAWAMELAGGALERLTTVPDQRVFEPLWSPDGSRLVASVDFRGPSLIDLARPIRQRLPRPLPAGPADGDFSATSWSADGDRLAGFDARSRLVLYSFAAGRQEVLPEQGEGPVWLRDGNGLLFLRAGAVHALDLRTRRTRKLLDPPAGHTFTWLSAGPGDRAFYLVSSRDEGDVCMLTLE